VGLLRRFAPCLGGVPGQAQCPYQWQSAQGINSLNEHANAIVNPCTHHPILLGRSGQEIQAIIYDFSGNTPFEHVLAADSPYTANSTCDCVGDEICKCGAGSSDCGPESECHDSLAEDRIRDLVVQTEGALAQVVLATRCYALREYQLGLVLAHAKKTRKHGTYTPWVESLGLSERAARRAKLIYDRLTAIMMQTGQSWPVSILDVPADRLEGALKKALDSGSSEGADGRSGAEQGGSDANDTEGAEAESASTESDASATASASTGDAASTSAEQATGEDGGAVDEDDVAGEETEAADGEAEREGDAAVDDHAATNARGEPARSDDGEAVPAVTVEWVRGLEILYDALDVVIPGPGLRETFRGFGPADFNALVARLDPLRERIAEIGDELDRVAEEVDEVKRARTRAKAAHENSRTVDT
jgi:hypothetical protein